MNLNKDPESWARAAAEDHRQARQALMARKHVLAAPFYISLVKKKLALDAGAILTDKYGPVEYVAKLKGDATKIATIERIRKNNVAQRGLQEAPDANSSTKL